MTSTLTDANVWSDEEIATRAEWADFYEQAADQAMLRVPFEWRPSVWAAAVDLAWRDEYAPSNDGPVYIRRVPTGMDITDAVQSQVTTFLAGYRPKRLEQH